MAVYGDQLIYFTEQFRRFEYFTMKPKVTGSYTERESLGTVTGILQFMKKGELLRENDTLNDVNIPTFWTRKKLDTEGCHFIQLEDDCYKIVNDYPWFFEGGFYCYGLETVVSNTDQQESFDYINMGQDDYA